MRLIERVHGIPSSFVQWLLQLHEPLLMREECHLCIGCQLSQDTQSDRSTLVVEMDQNFSHAQRHQRVLLQMRF
ncbi:MAG: hypothetical protein KF752_05570 [Pirellulaceae bacterium]|nr:hypothetical protein [Pirellulaceae bacterium]